MTPLPRPSERRLALRITRDALRQVRGGHPWVYGDSIESVSHEGRPGDLAVVFDDNRKFAAIGLWDPHSPISLRILHVGKPTPIDEEFWHRAIAGALARRGALVHSVETNAYRVVHGENDGLPSLVIDRYDRVVVIKLYSAAWFCHLEQVLAAVAEVLHPEAVVLRLARNVAAGDTHGLSDGQCISGTLTDEPVRYLENKLRFAAFPSTGQKTGAFLDQRENRALIRDLAEGRDVLDVFSYAGGFSVHAAAGGARSVHSVDQSPQAISAARRHMHDNRADVGSTEHLTTAGDAFAVMADLVTTGRRFGLVIVDPPSFAQRQTSVSGALKAYARLTDLSLQLTAPDGLLFQASCSSRVSAEQFYVNVAETARARGLQLTEIERTAHPVDHPIGFAQGAYLKAILARVEH